jgi:DNA-binding transcriptional ArsR family regulator
MVSKSEKNRAKKAAQLFSLLSSETRVAILQLLSKRKELQVQEIADELDMTHSAVSHQLGLLSEHTIVIGKKSGRSMLYRITAEPHAKALVRALQSAL